jgi:HAE1 family hydrophobic/amphiphilic exporter-1/multidrug efflux pump
MFTHFFIRRPVFASVCSILIILIGLVGYARLPVQEFPTIDTPTVTVTTALIGASPSVVETEVTEVLEEELSGIEGIKNLRSVSSPGISQISLDFQLDRDLEAAAQDVRGRIARAVGDLPNDAEDPIVEKSSGGDVITWFGIYGENYSLLELTDYADRYIIPQLESVRGVSSIVIGGERKRAMRVWLDPQRLAARGITVLDVENALRQQNVELPSGTIEGGLAEYSVRTLGRLRTPAEYEALIIQQNPDGSQTLLRDVGRAEIGSETDDSFVRLNGKPAIALGLNKISKANTLEAANTAQKKMAELSKRFPEGMNYIVAFDPTEFVRLSIAEAWSSLALAIGLVVLVIFFFLKDWRATLIPAVTLPVCLVGAFAVMYFLNYSINTLTLFALTLSTGLVVDDAIVVLENIIRYLREKNLSPRQAAFGGTDEVVFAVIATTVVLVAVFFPVAFSSGSVGRLFNEFALTIAGGVIISAFVALTLSPALAALILRSETPFRIFFLEWFEAFVNQSRRFYARSLYALMTQRWIIVIGLFVSLGLTVIAYRSLPTEFLPTEDRGVFLTVVSAPDGVNLQYTDRMLTQAEKIIQDSIPEAKDRFAVGGFAGSGATAPNRGVVFTTLQPWSERTEPQQAQQAIVGQLFGRFFGQITGAFAFPINLSGLPGAGFTQPVQMIIQGNDLTEIAQASSSLAGQAQGLPQLVNVRSNLEINKPELAISINRERAANLGVSVRDIARTLQILLGSQKITSFNEGQKRYEVVVQAEDRFRTSPEMIGEAYVRSQTGKTFPLSNLVDISLDATPAAIGHFNRLRSDLVEGSPAPGYTLGDALGALEGLAAQVLPDTVQATFTGESQEFRETGQTALFIFGLAVVFIFLVLAAQFESYIDPIVILLAVPLSLLGACSTLLVFGQTINVYSQIGIIMLIGLASKNSILIVEFANQLQEQGLSPLKAAIEAGTIRFRPILMTAFSTIFGLLPLALSKGAGAASRVPLGLAVIGGMLVSTFLSLYVVPTFYVILTKAQQRILAHHREV